MLVIARHRPPAAFAGMPRRPPSCMSALAVLAASICQTFWPAQDCACERSVGHVSLREMPIYLQTNQHDSEAHTLSSLTRLDRLPPGIPCSSYSERACGRRYPVHAKPSCLRRFQELIDDEACQYQARPGHRCLRKQHRVREMLPTPSSAHTIPKHRRPPPPTTAGLGSSVMPLATSRSRLCLCWPQIGRRHPSLGRVAIKNPSLARSYERGTEFDHANVLLPPFCLAASSGATTRRFHRCAVRALQAAASSVPCGSARNTPGSCPPAHLTHPRLKLPRRFLAIT